MEILGLLKPNGLVGTPGVIRTPDPLLFDQWLPLTFNFFIFNIGLFGYAKISAEQ
jgi:hypothetical protein